MARSRKGLGAVHFLLAETFIGKNELSLIYMHQAFRDAVGLDPKDVELKRVK